jgi:hypothetical protein
MSFHQRYLAGDYVQVWKELCDLGGDVFEERICSDALLVCQEVVNRAHFNLRILHERLLNLGYEFADPDAALVKANGDSIAQLGSVEEEFGCLPLIASVWYRTIASLDFQQADEQLRYRGKEYPPPSISDVSGLGSHPVLLVQSPGQATQQWRQMSEFNDEVLEREREQSRSLGGMSVYDRFLPLGSWASNCDPKSFPTGVRAIDASIYNDGAGDTLFVDALRHAFEWGGFPFWKGSLKKRRRPFYSPLEYRPNFEKVLPILKDGLLDL